MSTEPLSSPDNAEQPNRPGGASGFAIYWFGIPLLIIILVLLIRMQCGSQ